MSPNQSPSPQPHCHTPQAGSSPTSSRASYLELSPYSIDLVCGHILTAGLLQPGFLGDPLFHPIQPSFAFQTWRSKAISPRKPSPAALASPGSASTELLSESLQRRPQRVIHVWSVQMDILRPSSSARPGGVEGERRKKNSGPAPALL